MYISAENASQSFGHKPWCKIGLMFASMFVVRRHRARFQMIIYFIEEFIEWKD